jgi:hypothetical protein
MDSTRIASIGFGIAAAFGVMMAAAPAKADWDGHHWHHGHGWYRPWGPPVVVAPPPVYVAPPPRVYYAPPPVYYAPPPAYYAPSVSFGFTVR